MFVFLYHQVWSNAVCWLQPDQRPNAEEVHLLLSYLCAKGASEAEEDLRDAGNSMRPNTHISHANVHGAGALAIDMPMSSTTSSFPLLETVPHWRWLPFRIWRWHLNGYWNQPWPQLWVQVGAGTGWTTLPFFIHLRHFGSRQSHCQEVYYPPGGIVGGLCCEGLALGVSPSYYESTQIHTPGVVPVLSAHSPSVSNEYYIRIEEPAQSNIDMNFTLCAYSPEIGGSMEAF